MTISGPRNCDFLSVSGARNMLTHFYYFWPPKMKKINDKKMAPETVIFCQLLGPEIMEPETDIMVQFLAPEIVIMGQRNFMHS